MLEENILTKVQKKIISSILYGSYDIFTFSFARIYTSSKGAENWLYSGLEGELVFCVDVKAKCCRFFLFDLKSFEILFDCELYNNFSRAYKKGTERFYYFEVNGGFVGFEIPNMTEADILCAAINNFKDDYLKKRLKEYKPMKEDIIKKKSEKMIGLLKEKFSAETHQPKMLRSEIKIKLGLLEKMINTIEINEETGKFIIKGNGHKGIDNILLKLKGLDLVLEADNKVGDSEKYINYITKNFLKSYIKGLVIPKRKINRGQGIVVNKITQEEEDIKEEKKEQSETKTEKQIKNEDKKEKEKEREKEREKEKEKGKEREKVKEKEKEKGKEEKENKPDKKEVKITTKIEKATPLTNNSGSTPPPPPPPNIVIKKVEVPKDFVKFQNQKIDLESEINLQKKTLKHVEVKEYVSPALRKPGEEDSSSNSEGGGGMMGLILAKRNAMKKGSNTAPTKEKPPNSEVKIENPPPKPINSLKEKKKVEKKPEESVSKPEIEKKKVSEKRKPPEKAEPISCGGPSPPPPPPPPSIVIKKVEIPKDFNQLNTSSSSNEVNLLAEIENKKKNLAKVERKEYVPPALRKPGEEEESSSSGRGNSMMEMILAKRKAMKKGPGVVITQDSTPPPKKNIPSSKEVSSNIKPLEKKTPQSTTIKLKDDKKGTSKASKPINHPKPEEQNKPKPSFPSGEAKPPMKFGGGGGGFAAMRNLLAGRMAPQKKEPEAPKKPIIEYASGNTEKMDFNKLIGQLGKNMEKKEQTTVEKATILPPSGPVAPPPPPPPL